MIVGDRRKPFDSTECQFAEGKNADNVDNVDNANQKRKQKQMFNGTEKRYRGKITPDNAR